MTGPILAVIIVSPMAFCIGMYQCFNHGQMPFIDLSNVDNLNRVVIEE